jgi:adenylate kinase
MLNIVLFGPPGAGKGTQSQKLIDKYNLVHISTGDMLRREIKANTPLGIEAKKLIDDGNYVTDEMAFRLIQTELEINKNSKGFIFDGFPRTTLQAKKFPEFLSEYNGDVDVMISLDVDENKLIKRLVKRSEQSGRPDDREEDIIKKRIGIYNQRTACIKDYYKSLGKFEAVDGNGEIDVIFDKICTIIEKYK